MAQLYYSVYTVQTSQITGTLTDFPVLVKWTDARFKSVANGGHVNRSDGRDLVPYSDTTLATKLDFERIAYDPSTGAFIDWVRVSSAAVGSTITYGYGDTGITTDQSNKTGTWNSAYKLVMHGGSSSAQDLTDSTGTQNGTKVGSLSNTTGKINGAIDFANNASNYVTWGSNPYNLTNFTVQCWFRYDQTPTGGFGAGMICVNGDDLDTNFLGMNISTDKLQSSLGSRLSNSGITGSTTLSTGTLYLGHISYDGSTFRMYLNGASEGTPLSSPTYTAATGNDFTLSREQNNGGGFTFPLDGVIEEVRISNTARSSSWIAAEYNNQSAPTSFLGIGTEQSIGGGGGSSTRISHLAFMGVS